MTHISLLSNTLDIALTSILIYLLYFFFKGTYTATIVKGLLFSTILYFIAEFLHLNTIIWIFTKFFNNLPIILAILFQQDLRRFLSNLGRHHEKITLHHPFVRELAIALRTLSDERIGALIVIEGTIKLTEFLQNSIELDAKFSAALLHTIFYQGTHLHDGAVIIRDERIIAAQVFLPTSFLHSSTGTRHEAGITITADRDCISIIVSEETGSISYAKGGIISTIPKDRIEEVLLENLT